MNPRWIPATTLALSALLAACASAPPQVPAQALGTGASPLSFDGHVAGRNADWALVLVPDANPAAPGLALRAGERLQLALPAALQRRATVAAQADDDPALVLAKGWPQGDVRQADQYGVAYDEAAHALVVTALQDIRTEGTHAPGIKQILLRGGFVNTAPGEHAVAVTQQAADGQVLARWQGTITVVAAAPPARLAASNLHLPPGVNADFQKVGTGQVAGLSLGLMLWGPQGVPMNGVGIAPRDLARFPRYTGGLLVRDSNGDHQLDAAVDQVVGGIIGAAPAGATGQSATTPLNFDGVAVLSGEAPRHPSQPETSGGGKPQPGLMTVRFKAGSVPGLYRPSFELIGGGAWQFTIEAVAR